MRNSIKIPREMSLNELRREIAGLLQEDVAEMLDVTQGYVSQLEHRRDMSVRTLAEYVRVLGGELSIRARFGDEEIAIRLALTPEAGGRRAASRGTRRPRARS